MSTTAQAPLPRGLLIAFTLPTLVLGLMHGPEGQIQAIYAKHAGLALTALAAAMLLTRIFDAVTYPLIGYLCDRSYARSGTRRNWVIAGTAISMLGMWLLLRPPPGVSVLYFGIWTAVTYVGWKLMEIPLQAWSYGLSDDYAQRARVQAWRALALMSGQLLFFTTPYIALKLGYSDSTELDFRSLGVAAVICVVALPLGTLMLAARVPAGKGAPSPSLPSSVARRYGFKETLDAVRGNAPLMRLLAAFLPVNLLGGMCNGVAYLYMDAYLGLGQHFPAIMMLALPASLLGIPFWSAMAARYERHRVWVVSLVSGGLACAGLALVSPGPSALLLCYLLYPAILFTLVGAVIVYSMLADIVDYGRVQTGDDHSGLYAAIFAFLQKSLLGVSAAAAVAMAGGFGFNPTAATQTFAGVLGIKLTFAILPAIGLLLAAAIIWNYPLTRAGMAQISTRLKIQEAREP